MSHFVNIDEWEGVKLGINAECARSYRTRKLKYKKHFEKHGGYEDVEAAKSCPPEDFDPAEWIKLIDELFLDEAYRNRSIKNKANRSKLRYGSLCESQSYSQKRYMEVRKVVNNIQRCINNHIEISLIVFLCLHVKKTGNTSYIKGFKDAHWKEGTGWINKEAEADWKKIQKECRRMGKENSTYDEVEVLKHALGERRGHIRGVGRVVRSHNPDVLSSPCASKEHWRDEMKEELTQEIQQVFQQQMDDQARQQQLWNEQMQKMQQEFQTQLQRMKQGLQGRSDYESDDESDDEDD